LKPEDREDAIKHIEAGVKRGAEVIRQVLTFGRGVDGDRVAVSPAEMLNEIANIISQTFPKNIEVTRQTASDLWPIIGDKTQIHQVLLNLCINARDAMPAGGHLSLSAGNMIVDAQFPVLHAPAQPGPYVAFQVTDNGGGIAASDLERIFDPFFTTKDFGKGTGLGLSTVLGIVKSHHGLISVESKLKQGTTFKVLFPISAEAVQKIIPQNSPPAPRGQGEAILLVDDEVNIVTSNRRMLEKHGYSVLVANDGRQALEVLKGHNPPISLVVTDIMMPGMDGMGLIRALKSVHPNVCIIASSGLGSGLGRGATGEAHASELESLGGQCHPVQTVHRGQASKRDAQGTQTDPTRPRSRICGPCRPSLSPWKGTAHETRPTELHQRILVIDDNRAIHQDFHKVLCQNRADSAELNEAEAALFGEPLETETEPSRFQLDSAFQGRDGLDLVKQACGARQPYALALSMCGCHPAGMVWRPPHAFGRKTPICSWSFAPPTPIIRGRKWFKSSVVLTGWSC